MNTCYSIDIVAINCRPDVYYCDHSLGSYDELIECRG